LLSAVATGYAGQTSMKELDLILNGLVSAVSGITAFHKGHYLAVETDGFPTSSFADDRSTETYHVEHNLSD